MTISALNNVSVAVCLVETLQKSELATEVAASTLPIFSFLTENGHSSMGIPLIGSVALGIGTFLYKRLTAPSLDRILKMTEQRNPDEAKIETNLREFINKELISIPASQQGCKEFVFEKTNKILQANGDKESKKISIQNVIKNCIQEAKILENRLHQDLQAGKLDYLGIDKTDLVSKMVPIGDETHNSGKVPYQITFVSGKSIVYKPRSVLPEKLICDSEKGILRHEGFGTYGVISAKDKSGKYGYCQFLENKKEENTIQTYEGLKEYVNKMLKLELIARNLGLSDLHYGNIITDKLNPCIIDAEVFLVPPNIESGLLSAENGPLHVFANEYSKSGKNCFWIQIPNNSNDPNDQSMELIKEEEANYAKIERISKNCWENMGFNLEFREEDISLNEATLSEIEDVKKQLEKQSGRYILAQTQDLTGILKNDTGIRATEGILELIQYNCKVDHFEFLSENEQELTQAIQFDVENNDCPITFYESTTGTLYYSNQNFKVAIGRKRENL